MESGRKHLSRDAILQASKKKDRLLGPDTCWRGGGLHVKGRGSKSFVCPSKPRENKLSGGISWKNWRDVPESLGGGPKIEKKKFVFIIWPLSFAPKSPESEILAKCFADMGEECGEIWRKTSPILVLQFSGEVAARNLTKTFSTDSASRETKILSPRNSGSFGGTISLFSPKDALPKKHKKLEKVFFFSSGDECWLPNKGNGTRCRVAASHFPLEGGLNGMWHAMIYSLGLLDLAGWLSWQRGFGVDLFSRNFPVNPTPQNTSKGPNIKIFFVWGGWGPQILYFEILYVLCLHLIFSKVLLVQMGGVLLYKWEVYCFGFPFSRLRSQEGAAIQTEGVPSKKIDYIHINSLGRILICNNWWKIT